MPWWKRKAVSANEPLSRLPSLMGSAGNGRVVVVTDRGVELPLALAHNWDVITLTRLLAQIEAVPETTHPLGATA